MSSKSARSAGEGLRSSVCRSLIAHSGEGDRWFRRKVTTINRNRCARCPGARTLILQRGGTSMRTSPCVVIHGIDLTVRPGEIMLVLPKQGVDCRGSRRRVALGS